MAILKNTDRALLPFSKPLESVLGMFEASGADRAMLRKYGLAMGLIRYCEVEATRVNFELNDPIGTHQLGSEGKGIQVGNRMVTLSRTRAQNPEADIAKMELTCQKVLTAAGFGEEDVAEITAEILSWYRDGKNKEKDETPFLQKIFREVKDHPHLVPIIGAARGAGLVGNVFGYLSISRAGELNREGEVDEAMNRFTKEHGVPKALASQLSSVVASDLLQLGNEKTLYMRKLAQQMLRQGLGEMGLRPNAIERVLGETERAVDAALQQER